MKASERLRELDAVPVSRQWSGRFVPSSEYVSHGEIDGAVETMLVTLRNALPLIADVVEAAEAEVANAQLVCDEEILLNRALTALRDALDTPPGWGADRRCPETCG